MKIDETFLKSFINKCIDEGMDEEQVKKAYVIYCGEQALKDESFSNGFNSMTKQAGLNLSNFSKNDIHYFVGKTVLADLVDFDE